MNQVFAFALGSAVANVCGIPAQYAGIIGMGLISLLFGYLKHDEINKMIEYYFPECGLSIDFDPEISTASIIEAAKRAARKNSPNELIQYLKLSCRN